LITLEYNRRINSEISVEVVSGSITNATTVDDDDKKLMADESLAAI